MRWLAASFVLLVPATASAEQVVLKNGGRLSGILVERTADHLVLQMGPGLVTLKTSQVQQVIEVRSPLAEYQERARGLAFIDKEGWLDLAFWARDQGLETQARDAFARVLALEPQNASAQAALGNQLLNGRWVTPDESYRARGFVRYGGSWMSREERDEMIRDREEQRAAERARIEAAARIAEAEARARAAEAEARAAEASSSGIPWGYGGGYYGGGYYGTGYAGGSYARRNYGGGYGGYAGSGHVTTLPHNPPGGSHGRPTSQVPTSSRPSTSSAGAAPTPVGGRTQRP